jgi:predicted dehydrogenase
MTQHPLGVGLVGVGGFGEFCLAAFAEMPEIVVSAATDVDPDRAQKAMAFGAHVYPRYEDMLADPTVEIVAINTPPQLHARMTEQAAAAGKHIFVEKPLATSLQDGKSAVNAARAAGVQITVDYVLRFHPLHLLAGALIHSGAFGPFQHFSLENFATDETLLPDHWFWDKAQSGGIHVEHGVHFFDLCNFFAQLTPHQVCGCAQQRADGRTDRVSATVRYGDRALATFYHSFTQIRPVEQTTIRVNCARGHITLQGWIPTEMTFDGMVDPQGLEAVKSLIGTQLEIREAYEGSATTFRHGGTTEEIAAWVRSSVTAPDRQGDYKRAIQAGLRNLVLAIRGEQPLVVSAGDGLLSLSMALAATESAACGQTLPPLNS